MIESTSLADWDVGPEQLGRMREKLRRHPQFAAAAQRLAANLLRDAAEDASLDAMLRDAGHNVAALSAIYLHATGEVSLPRLKGFISGFGLVSAGRARTLLSYMLHLHFLDAEPASRSSRGARYRVTDRFRNSYARHEGSVLDAVTVIEPAVMVLRDSLDQPGVLERLVIEQGNAFIANTPNARPYASFFLTVLHRLAGIQILHSVVETAPAFPPSGDIEFSIPRVAQRFNVSRVHVGRLLEAAQAAGFVSRFGRSLRFTEVGLDAVEWYYSSRLCINLACAARMLKANQTAALVGD